MTEPKCPPAESLEEESQLARDEAVGAEILATRDLVAHLGILWETVERLDDLARRQAGYFAQDYLTALSGWVDCSPDNNRAALLGTYVLPFPVFAADADGRIESANAAFESLLPNRVGTLWLDAFPGIDGPQSQQDWREACQHGPPLTRKAGIATCRGESRFFDVVCQPLRGSELEAQDRERTAIQAFPHHQKRRHGYGTVDLPDHHPPITCR